MRFHAVAVILVLLFALSPAVNAAQPPRSEAEIPLYPGAVEEKSPREDWQQDLMEPTLILNVSGQPLPLRTHVVRFYSVSAPPEEALKFYIQRLAAKEGDGGESDPLALAPGENTPVYYSVSFYDSELRDLKGPDGRLLHSGQQFRDSLVKNRKPYQPGQWVHEVVLQWSRCEENGDRTVFEITLLDGSFTEDLKRYVQTKTWLVVRRMTFLSEEAVQEEEDAQFDQMVADKAKQLSAAPPTERELGVPIYPGAVFNSEASAGMSLTEGSRFHVFLSNDPVKTVLTFYEQKTGRKAESWEKDKYVIVLQGQLPFPERAVSIEPNQLFKGTAKTVLTFVSFATK